MPVPPVSIDSNKSNAWRLLRRAVDEGMSLLKTLLMMGLLVGASAAGAQPPDGRAEPASQPAKPPSADSDKGYRDLICKPNGTEDGLDCAVEPTPSKIVPIPSQIAWPRPQDLPIKG
jgi:hypothetical protein